MLLEAMLLMVFVAGRRQQRKKKERSLYGNNCWQAIQTIYHQFLGSLLTSWLCMCTTIRTVKFFCTKPYNEPYIHYKILFIGVSVFQTNTQQPVDGIASWLTFCVVIETKIKNKAATSSTYSLKSPQHIYYITHHNNHNHIKYFFLLSIANCVPFLLYMRRLLGTYLSCNIHLSFQVFSTLFILFILFYVWLHFFFIIYYYFVMFIPLRLN